MSIIFQVHPFGMRICRLVGRENVWFPSKSHSIGEVRFRTLNYSSTKDLFCWKDTVLFKGCTSHLPLHFTAQNLHLYYRVSFILSPFNKDSYFITALYVLLMHYIVYLRCFAIFRFSLVKTFDIRMLIITLSLYPFTVNDIINILSAFPQDYKVNIYLLWLIS